MNIIIIITIRIIKHNNNIIINNWLIIKYINNIITNNTIMNLKYWISQVIVIKHSHLSLTIIYNANKINKCESHLIYLYLFLDNYIYTLKFDKDFYISLLFFFKMCDCQNSLFADL